MAATGKSKLIGKLVGGLLFLIALAFLIFWEPAEQPLPDVPDVRPAKTLVVEPAGKAMSRAYAGAVRASERVDLSFRVSGPLVELPIQRGLTVEAGDLLARIDPRDFETRLARIQSTLQQERARLTAMESGERAEVIRMLESQLSAAKADFENARIEAERYAKLLKDGVVSQSEYEQNVLRRDVAKEKMDAAEQDLKRGREGARKEDIEAQKATISGLMAQEKAAADALADTRLVAPFGGRVALQFVENFQDVKAGQPILSLQNVEKVEVVANLPEAIIAVATKELIDRITVSFESVPGREYSVEFKEIETEADARTQTFAAVVEMDSPEGVNLLAGMPAEVRVYLAADATEIERGISVPSTAIFSDSKGDSAVWRVDPRTMEVHAVTVQVGEATGSHMLVTEGLQEGDEVVTAGVHFLHEGMKIRRMQDES